jgi:hypothetical protein
VELVTVVPVRIPVQVETTPAAAGQVRQTASLVPAWLTAVVAVAEAPIPERAARREVQVAVVRVESPTQPWALRAQMAAVVVVAVAVATIALPIALQVVPVGAEW